jgi:predicted nucleic acid-binding protein
MGDIVVDTNVLAYALLGVPETGQASVAAMGASEEILVPDILRAELANVVWQWVRAHRVAVETARAILFDGEALVSQVVPANHLWIDALDLSVTRDHPVYDTLFVALALQRNLPLLSWDKRLGRRFPETVMTPLAYLQAGG